MDIVQPLAAGWSHIALAEADCSSTAAVVETVRHTRQHTGAAGAAVAAVAAGAAGDDERLPAAVLLLVSLVAANRRDAVHPVAAVFEAACDVAHPAVFDAVGSSYTERIAG